MAHLLIHPLFRSFPEPPVFFPASILPKDSGSDRDEENDKGEQTGSTVFSPRTSRLRRPGGRPSAGLGTLFVFFSLLTEIGQDYGWGFFVGLPFAMGLTSAVTYGHHEKIAQGLPGRRPSDPRFSFILLLALAIEGTSAFSWPLPLPCPWPPWEAGWLPDSESDPPPQPIARRLGRDFPPDGL